MEDQANEEAQVEEIPAAEEVEPPVERPRAPILGPPQPRSGDLDCADFERQSFPVDPNNDPHRLDADGDGLACEPPPGD